MTPRTKTAAAVYAAATKAAALDSRRPEQADYAATCARLSVDFAADIMAALHKGNFEKYTTLLRLASSYAERANTATFGCEVEGAKEAIERERAGGVA